MLASYSTTKTAPSNLLLSCYIDNPLTMNVKLSMAKRIRQQAQTRRVFRRTFIRQWREHRGLTLERLAERTGMTAGNLSQLERGNQGYTQNALEALAEALQTDTASLLMRNPDDSEALWSIWDQAKEGERKMIIDIAKTVTKTGTGG